MQHALRPGAPRRAIVQGKPSPLLSSFKLSYYTLLNLMRRAEGSGRSMEYVIQRSFQQFQFERKLPALQVPRAAPATPGSWAFMGRLSPDLPTHRSLHIRCYILLCDVLGGHVLGARQHVPGFGTCVALDNVNASWYNNQLAVTLLTVSVLNLSAVWRGDTERACRGGSRGGQRRRHQQRGHGRVPPLAPGVPQN